MSRREYEKATIQYRPEGRPLVMKLGSRHFRVDGDEAISNGEIALPENILDGLELSDLPQETGVFVLTDPELLENISSVL